MILGLLLTWLAVTTNCDGSPTSDVQWYRVTTGEFACVGQDTDVPICIQSHISVDISAQTTAYRTVLTDDLAAGQGYWYRVEAIDGAGNSSEGCE